MNKTVLFGLVALTLLFAVVNVGLGNTASASINYNSSKSNTGGIAAKNNTSSTGNQTGHDSINYNSSKSNTGNITARNNTSSANNHDSANSPASKPIPQWVKKIFIWYGQGQVSDDELIQAIQFLIQSGIVHLK